MYTTKTKKRVNTRTSRLRVKKGKQRMTVNEASFKKLVERKRRGMKELFERFGILQNAIERPLHDSYALDKYPRIIR